MQRKIKIFGPNFDTKNTGKRRLRERLSLYIVVQLKRILTN